MPYKTELDIHCIHPNPRNKNVHTEESVNQLAANIKAYVLINPISVSIISAGQYELIAGERRWKAYQNLGRKKIPAQVYDAGLNDLTVDGMRLSENLIRTFNLVAECKELANLHQQGKSAIILARDFGMARSSLTKRVSIGYFPESLLDTIRKSALPWSVNYIDEMLPLRQEQEKGKLFSLQRDRGMNADALSIPLDGIYSYDDIIHLVEKIERGDVPLTQEALRAYVAQRRLELVEAAQDAMIQSELEVRLTAAKSDLEAQVARQAEVLKQQIGTEYQERLAELQAQLALAIREAQHMRDQRVRLEAGHTDETRKLRASMTDMHRKELEQKEKSFSDQLARLQKDLTVARQDKEKSLRDAEARLKKEYDGKIVAIHAATGKTQAEAVAAQKAVMELQSLFNQKMEEKERDINQRYEQQHLTLRGQVESITAERERWKREVVSRDEQLRVQAARVEELQRDHERQLTERQKDITVKDRRIMELVRQMAGIEAEAFKKSTAIAEKEAQEKAVEYRTQLDAEFDRKRQALEQSFAARQKALEIKVKKTGDDAINHFLDTINKLDASVRLVVYDLSEHLDRYQRVDILLGLRRIQTKIDEALRYVDGLDQKIINAEVVL